MKLTHTPAVKADNLDMVASPLGIITVHSSIGFFEAMNAGLVKIAVTTADDQPVTCFVLPLLGPSADQIVKVANRAVYDFVLTDLEAVLAQWAIDTLRAAPTVTRIMVSYPKDGQAQHMVDVARSILVEPTRWNNNRTTERVNESYAADTLLEAVAKAYGAIVKPQPAEQTAA